MLTLSREVVETRLHELQRDLERDPEGFLKEALRELGEENPAIHDLIDVFKADIPNLRQQATGTKDLIRLFKIHLTSAILVTYRAIKAQLEVNEMSQGT